MEMATAVVGLAGVGAQISFLLGQFISGCVNAPALMQTVHYEINDFNSILSLLQPLLLGSSPLSLSRASMIYVDQLALTITWCVCTLSELEKEVKEVNRLRSSGKMRVWDRLKWSRMEPTISQLFQRLLSHKSSLTLILTILTSPSFTEAKSCSVTLCGQLVGDPSRLESTLAISGDRTGPGPVVHNLDSTVDSSGSAVDDSELVMAGTDTQIVDICRLTCEPILFTTRPYRGRSNNSDISLISSQCPKPSWSLISEGSNRSVLSLPVSDYGFSGLSLAEASIYDLSTLSLPISADKLRNPRWYGNNTTGIAPSSLISARNRGGSSELPTSRDKIPTSLHHSAELGQMRSIKLFLEQGVDIEIKDKGGDTALHVAAMNNQVSAVGLLLELGTDMGALGQDRRTPLHYAARNGHNWALGLLLDRGADINAKAQQGLTPLHDAVSNGHDSTVGLLLDRGADMRAKAKNGGAPLHQAAQNGHDSTVKLLLDRGADIEAKTRNRTTPLHRAAQYGHDSTVELLLDQGADIEAKSLKGLTPLHDAVSNGHDSTLGLLLDRGADMEAICQNGGTPVHYAARNGHRLTVELLLGRGADMESKVRNGGTPLHQAALNGHDSTVGLLLDRGVDMEAKDQKGKTPLHRAAQNGHDSRVRLLLAKGQNGETPLHDLLRDGHDSANGLLLDWERASRQKPKAREPHPTPCDSEAVDQLLQEDIL